MENKIKKERVLIVDDYPGILNVMKQKLERRGYLVSIADSVEYAKKYEGKEFDIIILDGLDGRCFELYELLNGKRKIIYSGDYQLVSKAIDNGYSAHNKGWETLEEVLNGK